MTTPPNESVPSSSAPAAELAAAQTVEQVRAAFRNGQHEYGCSVAHAAIESGARHPSLYYLRGLCRSRRKEFEAALADFESAHALAPDDPLILEATGHCLILLERFREAIRFLDDALAIKPDFARAYYHKGVALGLLNEIDDMRVAHRRVVGIEPGNVDALASLAYIAARKNEIAETRAYGGRTLAIAPRHGLALVALAMADIEEGLIEAALEKLSSVLGDSASGQDGRLNMALGFAADALDRHGHFPEAFRLYSEINARRRHIHEPRFAAGRAIDETEKFTRALDLPAFPAPHNQSEETISGALGHVFILGFVRSGTTLLETILASNPLVVASDERDFLADAANDLLHGEEDLQRLANLGGDGLRRWRQVYWDGVRDAGLSVADKVFIDKVPLNSLRLPLIARLFPVARILLVIRNPRDVVLSTFRHRFNMYPASFEFLSLEDCARFYAAVMQLVDTVRRRVPYLRVYEVRYEDLVGDFDNTIGRVCAFAGIEWTEAMQHFQNASAVIDRRSQSAAQVRRGLYKGAAEHWRHYARELTPVLPILAPWIARFGYPET